MRKIVILCFLLGLTGCNHLRTFPLYSEVYVVHPDFIEISYYELKRFNTPELKEAHERVENYLQRHPEVSFSIKGALQALRVEKGMNKEQVQLIIGEPWERKIIAGGYELWKYEKYDEQDYRFLVTLNFLTELKFKENILVDYNRDAMWDKGSIYMIRKRIENYFENNSNLKEDIKTALIELKIKKGMNQEQVSLVVGQPTAKKKLKDNKELWIYKGYRGAKGERDWYYGWGKLKFKEGILCDIEAQGINIYK